MELSLPLLSALLDNGCNGMFTSPVVEFRSGSPPNSTSDATQGILICSISLSASMFGASVDGQVDIGSTWSGTAVNEGDIGWFRVKEVTDTNIASSSEKRIDGTVGTGNEDIVLDTVTMAINDTVDVTNFYLTINNPVIGLQATATIA